MASSRFSASQSSTSRGCDCVIDIDGTCPPEAFGVVSESEIPNAREMVVQLSCVVRALLQLQLVRKMGWLGLMQRRRHQIPTARRWKRLGPRASVDCTNLVARVARVAALSSQWQTAELCIPIPVFPLLPGPPALPASPPPLRPTPLSPPPPRIRTSRPPRGPACSVRNRHQQSLYPVQYSCRRLESFIVGGLMTFEAVLVRPTPSYL
jgi:hypothetical protein